ncbi:NGG1 interacting factor 3 [Rhizina undulata]
MAARSMIVRTVEKSVQRLYPIALADKSWDNTGLLLEAPYSADMKAPRKPIVLLTIDLTRSVVDEAIKLRSPVIVTYHPIIFRPLKSLTCNDTQQESLLRLVQAGISVYSPHTAVDAAIGGVNDWLADGISGGKENENSREVIEASVGVTGFEDCGMGRVLILKEPMRLGDLVDRVKSHLNMQHVMVAAAERHHNGSSMIQRIALCAGSGGGMLRKTNADLYFTGELSHHEALAANEKGTSTITCFHSNTERGFLTAVMKPKLHQVLEEEWGKVDACERGTAEGFEVIVSKMDKEPYEIV